MLIHCPFQIQIQCAIETLKRIRHRNVIKLYASTLNAHYPLLQGVDTKDHWDDTHEHCSMEPKQQYIETIELVMDYIPEKVARTYFKQIIDGLEVCHNANVEHGDLSVGTGHICI